MIQSYKRKSAIAAAVFVAVTVVLFAMLDKIPNDGPIGPLLSLTWIMAYWLAFLWFLKAKGREWLWAVWAVFPLIGLIVVLSLEDHAEDGKPPTTPPY